MNLGTLFNNNKNKNVGTLPNGKIPIVKHDSFNLFPNMNPYGAVEKLATQSKQKADIAVAQGQKKIGDYLKTEGAYLTKKRTPRELFNMLAPPVGGVEKVGAGIVSDAVRAGAKEVAPITESVLNKNFNKDIFNQKQVFKYKTYTNYIDNKYNGFAEASGLNKLNIGDNTIKWLDNLLSATPKVPSSDVIKELKQYRPKSPVTIYSGNSIGNLSLNRKLPTSFTSDINVAKTFGDVGRRDNPVIIRIKNVKPQDVVTSVDNLPKDMLKALNHNDSFAQSEHEIVTNKPLVDLAKKYNISISHDNGNTWSRLGGVKKVAPIVDNSFKGFTDYSTQLLDTLKGKTDVPTGYITSEINRLKGAVGMTPSEIGHYQTALVDATHNGKVNVKDFANSVHTNLLPITHDNGMKSGINGSDLGVGNTKISNEHLLARPRQKYLSINLPINELKNVVPNSYRDVIYNSPIKNDTGGIHFAGATKNYFAHVRRQDLTNGVRQVVETQSDLIQGNAQPYDMVVHVEVDGHAITLTRNRFIEGTSLQKPFTDIKIPDTQIKFYGDKNNYWGGNGVVVETTDGSEITTAQAKKASQLAQKQMDTQTKELNKLAQYKNTWYQPVIRSEVNQAIADGKKGIMFPTGETAMKIEGLNKTDEFSIQRSVESFSGIRQLKVADLKIGVKILDNSSNEWIVTDVLGNGKFKAVAKGNIIDAPDRHFMKEIIDSNGKGYYSPNDVEQFDISGKVNTSHGVYKKYEKIGKWLKNRLGAKDFTDTNGNTWYLKTFTKDSKVKPVQMFGKATIGGILTGVLGATAMAVVTTPAVYVVHHKDKPLEFPKMTFDKWNSVGAVIYGEARANPNDMMQIASTIYNRLKDPHNKGKNPYDIITQKGHAGYQYNAFGQKQYKIYKSGKFDFLGEKKAQMVKKIIDEMRAGTFKPINTATGFHYLHGKTLILDYKKLFSMLDMLGKRGSQLATTIGSIWQQHQVDVAKQQKIDNYALNHMFVTNAQGKEIWKNGRRILTSEYIAYSKRFIQSLMPPVGGIERIGADAAKVAAEDAAKALAPEAQKIGDLLSKGATQTERQFIKRIKEMAPEVPGLKGALTPRSTDALVAKADSIIAKTPDKAMQMAKKGKSDLSVAVASRLLDNFIGQAKIATDEVTKNTLYSKAAEVANTAAKNLTEHGRAIQAATILGKLTPEGMTRWAAGLIQKYNEHAGARTLRNFLGGAKALPELTSEQSKFIVDEMTRIEGITDKNLKGQAFSELQNTVKGWIPSSLYKKVIGLWKAGLLTGIKTSGLNILSNTAHGISEGAKDVPAVLVDKIASLFTGKRTLALTPRGMVSGVGEGIQKGWKFFRTGYDERNSLGKLDYTKVNFGKGRIAHALQAYEEKIFTILGSEDQPFYYGAKAHSLFDQAIAIAKNEGLKGAESIKRANEIIANPTEKMLEYAVLDAQTAVFQNSTALGTAARAIQNLPGGEIILPFGKTPSAVATQILNYTPVGIVKTIVENIGKGRFDQRLLSQGIGRGITGTGALFIGGALFTAGLMTGPRPTNGAQKKLWEIQGKQAYSIYYGGEWRNLGTLGPIGLVLGVGGAMRQGFDQTGSFVGGLGAALGAVGGTLTQQTFLYGINQAINALNKPSQYGPRFIRNLVGSAIPTIVADVARATDPYQRKANTVGQRIASRIPGLREVLPKRYDSLGNPEKSGGFFTTMLDATRPYAPTENLNDPVVKELTRLDQAGYNATPTMIGGSNGFKTLSPHENASLWNTAGTLAKQAIENIIQDPAYGMLDNEQKAKILEKVVGPTRDKARGQAIYQATKNLSGTELSQELQKMRTDKLLTKYTYAWYYNFGGRGKYPIITP